jgi:hypothetical protein
MGKPDASPYREQEQAALGEVIYRPLQAWSRPHPAKGVVTVHFATRDHPERRFTLTSGAARDDPVDATQQAGAASLDNSDGREQRGQS